MIKTKKENRQKGVSSKKYFKIRYYKNCLKASQIENKINYLEKKKIDADCFKEDKREFVKNNKLILKTQVFKSERHHIFTEEIKKIALSSNDNKKIPLIDLIETYAYGTSKDLVCKKEKS